MNLVNNTDGDDLIVLKTTVKSRGVGEGRVRAVDRIGAAWGKTGFGNPLAPPKKIFSRIWVVFSHFAALVEVPPGANCPTSPPLSTALGARQQSCKVTCVFYACITSKHFCHLYQLNARSMHFLTAQVLHFGVKENRFSRNVSSSIKQKFGGNWA